MTRLILSLDGQALAEYNMGKERYTIGRLSDNDVRIDNTAVSGHHALIINILNDSFLEDLNSTNGTYVNGKLIKKHALQHADLITIGHHQLRFIDSQADADGDEFQKTLVIQPTDVTDDRLRPISQRPPVTAPAAPTQTHRGTEAKPRRNSRLQVLSGVFSGRELELTKVLTTLGRPGLQVAAITRRGEQHYLIHVDSGAADDFPQVNGIAIGLQARRLADNDVITVAGVKMAFFEA
jgi:pSer/pThr/pTyr-binding forkhead associated (FHA) protein